MQQPEPTVPVPIRAVRYTGRSHIQNGYALAVQGPWAYDLSASDAIDIENVGVGIVTMAPSVGYMGTTDPASFPTVHVLMSRIARSETDAEFGRILKVIRPKALLRDLRQEIKRARENGVAPGSLMVVMDQRAFDALAMYCMEFAEQMNLPKDFDFITSERISYGEMVIMPGTTAPNELFAVREKIE